MSDIRIETTSDHPRAALCPKIGCFLQKSHLPVESAIELANGCRWLWDLWIVHIFLFFVTEIHLDSGGLKHMATLFQQIRSSVKTEVSWLVWAHCVILISLLQNKVVAFSCFQSIYEEMVANAKK